MKQPLEVVLAAMQADMNRLERVSSNLANALTPGFQREVAVSRALGVSGSFSAQVERLATKGAIDGPVAVLTDTRAGTQKSTGEKLDVAISGEGYFEVVTADGPAYTRAGQFSLDARGRLVDLRGNPVMGLGGEIYLGSRAPVIDANGRISENGKPIGQLKIVGFDKGAMLPRLEGGLLGAGPGGSVVAEGAVTVRQGFLENSNVSTMQEMLTLMQTMRHFESLQRAAASYDEMVGGAVRKLSEF